MLAAAAAMVGAIVRKQEASIK